MKSTLGTVLLLSLLAAPAAALDRPWIGDVFFYWYTWDYDAELGSWMGGIHNTPLDGYYDSRTFRDNRRSLWQASEWGMTHHFMDYWAPDWKGEDGRMREAVVMRAAESLRKEGYDVWMSYYQDGENFEMQEFSRNVSERRDVHQWLRDFAGSEVWPKIDGEPLQLVYARNGRPETTIDHEGFRRFLRERYGDVARLNDEWGTEFRDFDRIEMTFDATGHQRAASIEYQYVLWEREWAKLNGLVKQEFGFPGMRASFDVGYGPFAGFGFADFARTFGGPHSYGGIFDQPHAEDAERFIQAAVAKKYDTVFLDHFKNFYFDWDIRVPGTAYLPDPFHFDRFRVGALARHSEALLHLSWNEWWEGSNLEPCREFGKTYCEKNLLYSTLMKLAFDSIRTAGEDAPVAVLLNDWRFASGGPHAEELYGTIQILRRLGVPFDLVPDDFVTAQRLDRFRLVVAPAYGCGLGYNERREPILDVLAGWLEGGDRRLMVSAHSSIAAKLGLREVEPPAGKSAEPGGDLNVFVDVGAEGDDAFLRSGHSGCETGMRSGDDVTFRWTPAVGSVTSLVLPASPQRDHVLRLRGNALWPNTLSLITGGREIGSLEVPAGEVRVEAAVPAAAIGPLPMIRLDLRYAQRNVPGKIAPERYSSERRVCNLSLNHLQWSTANVPADRREQQYRVVDDSVRLAGKLSDRQAEEGFAVPFEPRPYLNAPGMAVLSELTIGKIPRDIALPFGTSQVLYVNGSLAEIATDAYWLPVLQRWASVDFHRFAVGEKCMAARLSAADTELVVSFNEEITEPRELLVSIPFKALPLSEAVVLSRDGRTYEPLPVTSDEAGHRARDALQYYGVYQFAFSPVRIHTPELNLQPGESKAFEVKVANLTDKPVRGHVQAASTIPTIAGEPAEVELEPGETKSLAVRISAAPTADWGRKTIYFDLAFADRRAVVLRELVVEKPTELELSDVILDATKPEVELRVPENPYGRTAASTDARLTVRGRTIDLPQTEERGVSTVTLPAIGLPPVSEPTLSAEKLRIELGPAESRRTIEKEIFVARKPTAFLRQQDAATVLVVFNARSKPLEHEPLAVELPEHPEPCSVRAQDGTSVPCQVDAAGRLRFLADVPARAARTFYVCTSKAEPATDLRCTAEDLGTGKGTLEVENSHLSVVLSEAAGGTVTRLRSGRTDRDYARNSFGVNYGTFSRHDPTQPRTNTVEYIHESKTRQEDSTAQIELISKGPAAVVARVRWADERVQVEQTYEFPAFQRYFKIRQKVKPIDLAGRQELVALDARFQPHRLTKSFPNFVGVVNDKEQPHFGWRQGTWVPDYATLMAPNDFDESLSLVIAQGPGLVGIRQGFWPAERPKPGKCEIAEIELLADPAAGCDVEAYVLLHAGHQIVAKRFLADLRIPPKIDVVDNPQWIGATSSTRKPRPVVAEAR
ncbi:MAG TPA: hypothetical protein VMY37_21810 [Thermoguttaceae bacterium]|nr:hypothetical protein [Thermoguttaceae bacterium]